MENKMLLLNTVLLLISISLFILIIFREKVLNLGVDYYKRLGNKSIHPNEISIIDNKIIIDKIAKIESEVLRLKKENERIVQQYEKNNFPTGENNNNFRQILNYNSFKEKNGATIDMYKQGISKEEIARILNKSIREIEMVINLIK